MTLVEIHGDIPTRTQFGCAYPATLFYDWLVGRGFAASISEIEQPLQIPVAEAERGLNLLREFHQERARA